MLPNDEEPPNKYAMRKRVDNRTISDEKCLFRESSLPSLAGSPSLSTLPKDYVTASSNLAAPFATINEPLTASISQQKDKKRALRENV
jgi:hypothetical protein